MSTGREYRDQPLIGIIAESGRRTVCAVGREALNAEAEALARGVHIKVDVINPLEHARVFVGDGECLSALLRYALMQVDRQSFLRNAFVIHAIHNYASRLSEIERAALITLGRGGGARSVHVHEGADLSDADVRAIVFPDQQG